MKNEEWGTKKKEKMTIGRAFLTDPMRFFSGIVLAIRQAADWTQDVRHKTQDLRHKIYDKRFFCSLSVVLCLMPDFTVFLTELMQHLRVMTSAIDGSGLRHQIRVSGNIISWSSLNSLDSYIQCRLPAECCPIRI